MNIDLLAKMVKEAILDHDAVTLPGVGSFIAELMPSSFTDKGYTIHPPYRRLFFSPRQGNDTLLADIYARDNHEVDQEMALRILTEFLSEMKEVLKVRKTVVLPGLGRLRATRENHFFFVADEDLDIYPEGLGLAPLSLKTHVESPEEVASAVAGLAELISEPIPVPDPEPTPVPEPEPTPVPDPEPTPEPDLVPDPDPEQKPDPAEKPEPDPEPASAPAQEHRPVKTVDLSRHTKHRKGHTYRKWKRSTPLLVRILQILLIVVLLLLLAFILIGRFAPTLLDPLLYNAEELEILRY